MCMLQALDISQLDWAVLTLQCCLTPYAVDQKTICFPSESKWRQLFSTALQTRLLIKVKNWTFSTVAVYHSCFSKCSPANFNWKKQTKNKHWRESRRKPTPSHHHKVAWPKVAPHTCVYGRGRLKKSTCDSAHRFCSPWFLCAALGPVWFLNLSKLVFI